MKISDVSLVMKNRGSDPVERGLFHSLGMGGGQEAWV